MSLIERCPECPGINNVVPPDGPEDSDLLFLGEGPGKDEDRSGHPFTGKTGWEVNAHYLPLAGLRRANCRFDNAIRCLPPGRGGKLDSGKPRDIELLESCSQFHLSKELERDHRLVIPMGAFACRAIDPSIDLDLHHGIPRRSAFGWLFPMYHPARGIHEPKKMLQIRTDWYRLKRFLTDRLAVPQDEYPEPDYSEIKDQVELGTFFMEYDKPLSIDTESTRKREPFCLTFSNHPGEGRLIRSNRPDLLAAFQDSLNKWEGPIIFHNWMYDYFPISKMGLHIRHKKVVDTMVMAYHLGNLPQGLKALAYRELGMDMLDFDDLVTPYSLPKVLEYFRDAYRLDWPRPDEELVRDEQGKWKSYRPQSMKTKLKRFFTDYDNNPEKDVFKSWGNWEMQHDSIEEVAGLYPGKCITHVPFDKVINYACRDSDSTLRLYPLLKRMISKVRKVPQERWGDT